MDSNGPYASGISFEMIFDGYDLALIYKTNTKKKGKRISSL